MAGATHAPITAILIIFELTNDYKIILPLMISSIIATLLTTKLKKESIYTLKLIRRGVDLFLGREINILRSLKVSEVMIENPVIIPPEFSFKALLELVVNSPHSQFFVVDHDNRFVGAVSLQEVRQALLDQDYLTDLLIALDLVNPDIPLLLPQDNLDSVMKLFGGYDMEQLPVVNSRETGQIIGIVNRKDVIDAYNHELVKRNLSQEISTSVKLLERMQKVDFIDDYIMTEVPVPPSFVGKSIKQVNIGARFGIHVLMIKRKKENNEYKQIVPSADEMLHIGDLLVVMGKDKEIDLIRYLG
ncbi:MAG: CBS domain-containing protein [Calditrichia bacterium]